MQRNASTQLHGAGRPSHRQSGDFRGRRSLGANTETVVGVAQIPTSFPDDQARTNGVMSGAQQLDMARSPPNTTSKSSKCFPVLYTYLTSLVLRRYQTRSLQVLQAGCLSSWTGVPFPSLD